MISLRQNELSSWQDKNFPPTNSMELVVGMMEELGELAHAILKSRQKIRGYDEDRAKAEIADAFADVVIYGINLMSIEGLDAETAIRHTIDMVLSRDWVKYPQTGHPLEGR